MAAGRAAECLPEVPGPTAIRALLANRRTAVQSRSIRISRELRVPPGPSRRKRKRRAQRGRDGMGEQWRTHCGRNGHERK
ncbi:hypothetical protein [Micromonospora sp. NBC_00617]|uniref:hypothetical protein n=1 Tax=Micromonospora sp. NBC_00617 TaxID=2903587 RepID=UPI0030DFA2E0